jgi:hypothetical protein
LPNDRGDGVGPLFLTAPRQPDAREHAVRLSGAVPLVVEDDRPAGDPAQPRAEPLHLCRHRARAAVSVDRQPDDKARDRLIGDEPLKE